MMKRILLLFAAIVMVFASACGPKPAYKTSKGKKRLKKYNAIQYNKRDWDNQRYRGKKKRH